MVDNEQLLIKIENMEAKLIAIQVSVALLSGEARVMPLVIKWLCFPLISILGGLVGFKVIGGF